MLRSTSLLSRAAAVLAGATLIAACGSGSHNSTHPDSSATVRLNGQSHDGRPGKSGHAAVRLVHALARGRRACPNPVAAPAAFKHSFSNTARRSRRRMTACGHLLPASRTRSQGRRARSSRWTRCWPSRAASVAMASPAFPDPTSNGSRDPSDARAGRHRSASASGGAGRRRVRPRDSRVAHPGRCRAFHRRAVAARRGVGW